MTAQDLLLERFRRTQAQIQAAARRCDRNPAEIRLLAVSKQHSAEAVRCLAEAGQYDFGESYVQEALEKIRVLQGLDLTWHFIGQIQSNKTRQIAEHFAWVHTLDRLKIAQRLSEQRPHYAPPLQVCIQVKLADEFAKGGVAPEHVTELASAVAGLPQLRLRGLMCIPPPTEDVDRQLAYFAQMRRLLECLQAERLEVDTLSMGMSGDFEAAVAAGATIVRMGTAIFGERVL